MLRSLIYSITFHSILVLLTILSLPFMLREPIDLPPIVSVELIQISDKTSIPYAPKARKIIEETKKKKRRGLYQNKRHQLLKLKKNQIEFLYLTKKKKKNKLLKRNKIQKR